MLRGAGNGPATPDPERSVAPIVIAHRTCPHDAAENSLEGIRVADRAGAEAVEIDVRLTSDGHPVLMHDRWLWRTTRTPRPVARTPLRLVRGLRLRGCDETVPTFAEALDALGARQSVAIDVKDPRAARVVLAEVLARNLEARAMFWAKSTRAVAYAVAHAPQVEPSLLRDARRPGSLKRFLDDANAAGARGISAHWSVIEPGFVDEARRRGLRVYAWCQSRDIDAGKVALLDGLVTDWPVLGREIVGRAREPGGGESGSASA